MSIKLWLLALVLVYAIWLLPYFKYCHKLRKIFILSFVSFLGWIAAGSLIIYFYEIFNWQVHSSFASKTFSVFFEEWLKFLMFLIIFLSLRKKIKNLEEIVLLGVFVGLGFGFYENLWYMLSTNKDVLVNLYRQFLVNGFVVHWLNGALMGLIFGKFYWSYDKKYLFLLIIPLILHLFYNLSLTFLYAQNIYILGLLGLLWLFILTFLPWVIKISPLNLFLWWILIVWVGIMWYYYTFWQISLFLTIVSFFVFVAYVVWTSLSKGSCKIF